MLSKANLIHFQSSIQGILGGTAYEGDNSWGSRHGKRTDPGGFSDRAVADVPTGIVR